MAEQMPGIIKQGIDRVRDFIDSHRRLVAAGTIIAMASGVTGAIVESGNAADAPDGSTTPTTIEVLNHDLVMDALTVTTTTVDCTSIAPTETVSRGVKVVKFDVGAVKPHSPNAAQDSHDVRLWSDALSTPLSANEKDNVAQLTEIQKKICQDPELGSTLANMFANMQVNGIKVLELNQWLKPFEGDPAKINDRAKEFMPLLDNSGTPNTALANKAVEQSRNYQRVAELLDTLLTRFKVDGVKSGLSQLNFHLKAGGLVAGDLPEVELNPTQDSLPAFRLKLDEKTGKCIIEIGFNRMDKRPEEFAECVTSITTSKGGTTPKGGRRTPGRRRPGFPLKTDSNLTPGIFSAKENNGKSSGKKKDDDGSNNPVGGTTIPATIPPHPDPTIKDGGGKTVTTVAGPPPTGPRG